MLDKIRIPMLVCLGAALLSITDVAAAQGVQSSDTDGGYGSRLDDDPLDAGGFSEHDAVIKVRPKPIRTLLLQLRTSFVPEMLRTVEKH